MFWLIRRPFAGLPLAALLAAGACSTASPPSLFVEDSDLDSSSSSTDTAQTGEDHSDDGEDPGSSSTTGTSGTTGDAGEPPDSRPARPGPDHGPDELYAAIWRDLDAWSDWSRWVSPSAPWAEDAARWGLPTVGHRWSLLLQSDGTPAVDVPVSVVTEDGQTWTARSDARGRAELIADFGSPNATLYVDGLPVDLERSGDDESTLVEVASDSSPPLPVDIMFVIDTTGSMGAELTYLQERLEPVLAEVQAERSDPFDLRLSLNFYRDDGEDYVLRSSPFTTDLDAAFEKLDEQEASGGGDLPEAVDRALQDAVFDHQWSTSARARLLFLVLDAPARTDPDTLERLHAATRDAARQGIRIMPVTGTGTEEATAFLVRQLAISTGGTYAFVTEPSDLAELSALDTVGAYEPRPFDQVLKTLIADMV